MILFLRIKVKNQCRDYCELIVNSFIFIYTFFIRIIQLFIINKYLLNHMNLIMSIRISIFLINI